jgi:hypothetical protein
MLTFTSKLDTAPHCGPCIGAPGLCAPRRINASTQHPQIPSTSLSTFRVFVPITHSPKATEQRTKIKLVTSFARCGRVRLWAAEFFHVRLELVKQSLFPPRDVSQMGRDCPFVPRALGPCTPSGSMKRLAVPKRCPLSWITLHLNRASCSFARFLYHDRQLCPWGSRELVCRVTVALSSCARAKWAVFRIH